MDPIPMPSTLIVPRLPCPVLAQPGSVTQLPLTGIAAQIVSRLMIGIVALALLSTSGASLAQIWLTGEKSLASADLAANRVLQSIPLAFNASALAVDSRSGFVWALTSQR